MPATLPNCLGRLEMAGGEFCGNATRCLAALVGVSGNFFLETSGLQEAVLVKVSKQTSTLLIPLDNFKLKNSLCILPGISHLLLKNGKPTKESARKLLKESDLLSSLAAGVIGYEKTTNDCYKIKPVVWVKKTKTFYEETACASGTAALAYMLFKKTCKRSFSFLQPSGAMLTVKIAKTFLTISGPILSIKKRFISMN